MQLELTQKEIDDLAKGYAQGRLAEWMILDAVDDDQALFQRIVIRSKDFDPHADDGEAIVGLI